MDVHVRRDRQRHGLIRAVDGRGRPSYIGSPNLGLAPKNFPVADFPPPLTDCTRLWACRPVDIDNLFDNAPGESVSPGAFDRRSRSARPQPHAPPNPQISLPRQTARPAVSAGR